jgi:hypothetical protein
LTTTAASSLTIDSAIPGTSNSRIARSTHWSMSGGAAGRGAGCAASTAAAINTASTAIRPAIGLRFITRVLTRECYSKRSWARKPMPTGKRP